MLHQNTLSRTLTFLPTKLIPLRYPFRWDLHSVESRSNVVMDPNSEQVFLALI